MSAAFASRQHIQFKMRESNQGERRSSEKPGVSILLNRESVTPYLNMPSLFSASDFPFQVLSVPGLSALDIIITYRNSCAMPDIRRISNGWNGT